MPRPTAAAIRLTHGRVAYPGGCAPASDARAAFEARYRAMLLLHRCRQDLAGFQSLLARICDRDEDARPALVWRSRAPTDDGQKAAEAPADLAGGES